MKNIFQVHVIKLVQQHALFPRRFNVESTWCVCRVLILIVSFTINLVWHLRKLITSVRVKKKLGRDTIHVIYTIP